VARARRHVAENRPRFEASRELIGVMALDIADGQVRAIRSVVNPEKLGHVGRPSRAWPGGPRDRD